MFSHKKILITGGTGSFGQAFTAAVLCLYPAVGEIVIFSRNPGKQEEMRKRFPQAPLRFISGDIADGIAVENACQGMDLILHTAAMRTVPEAENEPWQAVSTNVTGAYNLIQAAVKHNIGQLFALSTDMASLANNVYGATKMLADKLFIAAHKKHPSLKTSIFRLGNIAGSQETVIPFFIKKAREEGILPVTDSRMTRFMASREDYVSYVLRLLPDCLGGEILVPKIKSYDILTVARAVDPKAEIRMVGLRPGEKLYQEMITRSEAFHTLENKDYYIIVPLYADREVFCRHYAASPVAEDFEFNSENNPQRFTTEEIEMLIKKLTEKG